jgi:hypothetical protein
VPVRSLSTELGACVRPFDKSLHLTYIRIRASKKGVALRPDNEVVSRKLGDRLVLVNLRTNRIYELNRTAARVWELLDAGSGRSELEEVLLGEFDVEDSVLSQDVGRMLDQLSSEGLIEELEAA